MDIPVMLTPRSGDIDPSWWFYFKERRNL